MSHAIFSENSWPIRGRYGLHSSVDSIFITYDEHGGYFDHVPPPQARQGFAKTPDGISRGQCADLSNPLSLQPGGGVECRQNLLSKTDTTTNDAAALCPAFAADPTGLYPEGCATFDQLGVRVPLLAVSPFSKQHHISHTVGDHTSLLAFIEKRFLSTTTNTDPDRDGDDDNPFVTRQTLTERDWHAHALEDQFDFDQSPSLNVAIVPVPPPVQDCTLH